ncbi:hypothetical protein GOODEAATRI_022871 [Goodea atripinnis]|uniref:Uncharacterized protein n=1 Tax=Goodea atripinnis TaxID=208336 RepID=A0ABV0Q0Y5_9TELE
MVSIVKKHIQEQNVAAGDTEDMLRFNTQMWRQAHIRDTVTQTHLVQKVQSCSTATSFNMTTPLCVCAQPQLSSNQHAAVCVKDGEESGERSLARWSFIMMPVQMEQE